MAHNNQGDETVKATAVTKIGEESNGSIPDKSLNNTPSDPDSLIPADSSNP